MKLGIVPKLNSVEALQLAKLVLKHAESKGLAVYLDSRARDLLTWDKFFQLGRDQLDMLVVIGGDGTVLNTLHLLKDAEVPVATIRYGRRGFLCDVPPFEYSEMIARIASGDYRLVEYMRLEGSVRGVTDIPPALNELAIVSSGSGRAKVIRLYVQKDGEELYRRLVGDGLIVATPVGSTAYSLAAGGPILDPLMDALVLTPLASITLCTRPVVLPSQSEVAVTVSRDSPEAVLIVDGAYSVPLKPRDSVIIRKYPKPAKFARFYVGDYYVKIFERCL
ncbi:MAG: NAD(+)/NADH kinase [Zestosphaera sp.]